VVRKKGKKFLGPRRISLKKGGGKRGKIWTGLKDSLSIGAREHDNTTGGEDRLCRPWKIGPHPFPRSLQKVGSLLTVKVKTLKKEAMLPKTDHREENTPVGERGKST